MNKISPLLTSLVAFAAYNVHAQSTRAATVLEDFKPSSLNQPGQEYPQVNSQEYVRLRVMAPQAQSVVATLGGRGGTVLTKNPDGSWTATTQKPEDEGFHYYHLSIDG